MDHQELLTFKQAIALLPTPVSRQTFSRYCHVGLRGIRLRTLLMAGNRRYTTRGWLFDFLAATCKPTGDIEPPVAAATEAVAS
jgi:hypothetical protein